MGIEEKIVLPSARVEDLSSAAYHPPIAKTGEPVFQERAETRFLVTIDTEEAFDWSAPFRRDGHSVTHIPALERFQRSAERHGAKPVYLIDYPVATDPAASEFFRTLLDEGRAYIGAHLHPWNTPPFDEDLSVRNSYGCNLDPALEQAKFDVLLEAIAKISRSVPLMFRAGRYGAGKATADLLQRHGIKIDSSVRPLFDYRRQGGPDFTDAFAKPYWLKRNSLAEFPVTSIFTGGLHTLGPRIFGSDSKPSGLRGPLSRLKLLSRTPLTPEGIGFAEAARGVDHAIARALPLLVFSFHSSSVVPGNTNYVTSDTEADSFHLWWDSMFAHLASRGIAPADLVLLEKEIFV